MKIYLGSYDAQSGTVPVTFRQEGSTVKRPVNAVLDSQGQYDRTATRERAKEVGRGVAHKLALGVVG